MGEQLCLLPPDEWLQPKRYGLQCRANGCNRTISVAECEPLDDLRALGWYILPTSQTQPMEALCPDHAPGKRIPF